MDNFFSDAFDYNMFKKAMKVTNGESIIINISSTDSSLFAPAKTNNMNQQPRKSMSSKFEPSPFGKFFGSKKKNSNPIDMSDFTSWKNKNYRGAEKSLDLSDTNSFNNFSLSSFLNDNSDEKFNELDQARFDLQKPIEQLPIDDPKLKKFSLDSYMHKLEESILAKDKFSVNDDLLEPIVSDNRDSIYDPDEDELRRVSTSINRFQSDEDFSSMDINFERFAFDDNTKGSEFSLDQDELDKVKRRLERMERHSQQNKSNPNELLLPAGFDVDGEDEVEEEPELDEIDRLFTSSASEVSSQDDEDSNTHRGKKLNEVVINKDADKAPLSSNTTTKRPILFTSNIEEEVEVEEEVKPEEPTPAVSVDVDTIKKSDILTKEDLKDITSDFMSKFSELYKTTTAKAEEQPIQQPVEPYYQEQYQEPVQQPMQQYDYQELMDYKNAHNELQMKIHELVEDKQKTDRETEEKLKRIEEERNKIDEEYKNKLKAMEESYSKKYEEFKQKMYLDKANQERKAKENEEKIKVRDAEIKSSKDKADLLKKELKSYFNIANLEMEKKLLEVSAGLEKEENKKLKDIITQKVAENQSNTPVQETSSETPQDVQSQTKEEPLEVKEEIKTEQTESVKEEVKTTPKKTSKPRTRKPKSRKIDKDIIGGIDF